MLIFMQVNNMQIIMWKTHIFASAHVEQKMNREPGNVSCFWSWRYVRLQVLP